MGSRHKGRIIAFQALYSWDFTGESGEKIVDFSWLDKNGHKSDDSLYFARLLVSGTLENISEIDSKIKQHIDHWDFKRIAKVDLAILRLSTYSLLYQKEIAGNIVIDEAVDISKEYSSDNSYRFINGVLDSIYKEIIL